MSPLFIFFNIICYAHSYRILGIFSHPFPSHQSVFQPIWRELSLRGHNVTILTANPLKDSTLTNLTEIDWSDVAYSYAKQQPYFSEVQEKSWKQVLNFFANFGIDVTDILLDQPENLRFFTSLNVGDYDVLLMESSPATWLAVAHMIKAPVVLVTSMEGPYNEHDAFGDPVHPAINYDANLPYGVLLNFWQRLESTFHSIVMRYIVNTQINPKADRIIRKHFGPGIPPVKELQKNASLYLTSSLTGFHTIRQKVPAVIQLNGIHLKPPKPLPMENLKEHLILVEKVYTLDGVKYHLSSTTHFQDLQEFLDSSPEGVIYFSLGSNVKSNIITHDIRQIFFSVFAEIPYKVLWKFDLSDLPGKPDNVMISKWFPQQDVFRHPNIKLFITQGGLQSIEEALRNHIPLIGMPCFGDQFSNVNRIVDLGIGLKVEFDTLTKETLKHAILEVISDSVYRTKASEIGDVLIDKPMQAIDQAVWWIEYVIRHKGARHLRSPIIDMPLYQYLLLDVVAFTLLSLLFGMFIVWLIVQKTTCFLNQNACRIKFKSE